MGTDHRAATKAGKGRNANGSVDVRSIVERKTNDDLRKMMGIESVMDVVKRNRLRWLGHVLRKDESDWVRGVLEMSVVGSRGRGRPRKTWLKVVEEEMRVRR